MKNRYQVEIRMVFEGNYDWDFIEVWAENTREAADKALAKSQRTSRKIRGRTILSIRRMTKKWQAVGENLYRQKIKETNNGI